MRNNLLLGKKAEKVEHPEESLCYICNEHKETRVLLFLGYKIVQKLLQFLKRVLIKAGCLKNGSEMSLFFFKNYNINSIENISLVTLWNFVYNNKFNSEKLQGVPCIFWIKTSGNHGG